MATVLKTVGATHREFESHRFRKDWLLPIFLCNVLLVALVDCVLK